MRHATIRRTVFLVVALAVVFGAVRTNAQDTLDGLAVIYVTGVSVIAVGTSVAFTLGNNYLVDRDRGNVFLGTGGFLVGMPTALLGLAISVAGVAAGSPVAVLPGALIGWAGFSAMVAGAKSIRTRTRRSRLSSAEVTVAPGVFSGGGDKTNYGLQMTIAF